MIELPVAVTLPGLAAGAWLRRGGPPGPARNLRVLAAAAAGAGRVCLGVRRPADVSAA